ncbi:TPR-like protein [Aspergillus sclerotiicarbonarius CBS 121057]|uniref:TPR-like protein n=1 Tax=Aspergillus sclerotiicarbonarius (strain CBS 121057 / IBT 28362) TaxID=1448318 RepID=A0A319FP19_ASPSB|nr:TPR-like protein [Aspergillus sclerotiicarbonarius CBS 121057]
MGFTHEDYTVAWVCALPLEMAAAKFMLDHVHPSLPQPKTDHNTYTLGSVNGHNVVVACLPSGVYGTTTAAIVLAHMLPTFTSLRFALIVGIGGGVPSKTDIQLGDVVFSMPTAACGGVIQYDYGKTLRDGQFQRTGLLNKPPQYLLTAVSQLRSDYMVGESTINIPEICQKKPNPPEQFWRPENDWLFNPNYDHQSEDVDCSACAPTQLVDRLPRESNEPLVHYGLIASGNQVIKNARIQDSIARELNILCFEMEAAGLMDQLPCLVIRGICDYCDTHKHKQWQGYAAFTAAAYTRALLGAVPLQSDEMTYNRKTKRHWMVPFTRNSRFVGRQNEIDRLEELTMYSSESSKSAICGLGGIGKTQIALELAYRIRDKTSEYSIFWIPCTSYEPLGQNDMSPARSDLTKEQVKAYLSQCKAGKWLLIFDNADDSEMWTKGSPVAPPLKSIVPQSENGHVLFTTRNRKLAVKLASSNVLSIPDMDQSTAKDIFEKSLIRKDLLEDNYATTTVLEQLGFLPLAISEYLSLLSGQENNTIEMLSEEFEDDGRYAEIQNPVATTWLISFLQIQKADETAIDLLSFMACINPRDIPKSILPPAPSPKIRVEALGLLKAYSFISEQVYNNGSLSLHRLVHLATRGWLRRKGTLDAWVDRAASQLDNTFSDHELANRELWRAYLPHALYLTDSTEFQGYRHKYDKFLLRIGRCLQSDGRYQEGRILLHNVLEIREKGHGPEHPDTLNSVSQLGSVLNQEGKYKEAESMHRRALEGREKALGPKHPDTLTSISQLGAVLERQGRYKEAEALHRHALESRERILGPELPNTFTSVSKLGSVLKQQGKYEEARGMHRKALEGRERVLGPEHPNTLTSVSQLGTVLEQQGKYDEAEAMHQQALDGYKKALGPAHPNTLISMSKLGSVLERQGKYEEAEAMHQQALEGYQQALGPEHPDTLTSKANIVTTFRNRGRLEEAEELGIHVLEIRKRNLKPEHPNTLSSMADLACTWRLRGKPKNAEVLMEECFALRSKILGRDHPDTKFSRHTHSAWKATDRADKGATLVQFEDACST